jgi:hypothetical protein
MASSSWTRSSCTSPPVLVGDGVRLFERAGGAAVKLTPTSSADEGGMTVLRYSLG